MIIRTDSVLRRLPSELDPKRRLFVDGIRYAVEMADMAYSRLCQTLLALVVENRGRTDGLGQRIVSSMLDAWSVIDSVQRLRNLLVRTPRLSKRAPPVILFNQCTEKVEELRHIAQHLDEKIYQFVQKEMPIWGSLSWFVMEKPGEDKGFICSIVAGTLFKSKNHPVVNPLGKAFDCPVDLIELTANECTASLSETMKCVRKLISWIERTLQQQIGHLGAAGADLFLVMEVSFNQSVQPAQESARIATVCRHGKEG